MLDCQSYLNFLQCVGGIRVKKVIERLKKIFSNVIEKIFFQLQLVGA